MYPVTSSRRAPPQIGGGATSGSGVALLREGVPFADIASLSAAVRPSMRPAFAPEPDCSIGIIFNRRAHRNLREKQGLPPITRTLDWASPHTKQELGEALARFAARKIDVLVVDGGDGTIRDVLSMMSAYFHDALPTFAIIPSGKTNALAIDLGLPVNWSLDDALGAIASGRTKQRSPIEIRHAGSPAPHLRGFLFGAGAFVDATALAQGIHEYGGFRGVAVGLSLAAAILQTVFGGRENRWRRGLDVRVSFSDGLQVDRPFYLILGSTLKRLPLGLRPFGRVRSGLKMLGVDAPPRHVLATLPALLAGSEARWLDRFGYHRRITEGVRLGFNSSFVLDGETYAGGDLVLGRGAALDFVVP